MGPTSTAMSEDQQPVLLIQIVSSDFLEMNMGRATSSVGDVRGPVTGLSYPNRSFLIFGNIIGRATSGVGDVRGPVTGLSYPNRFFLLLGYAMGEATSGAGDVRGPVTGPSYPIFFFLLFGNAMGWRAWVMSEDQ